MITRVGSQNREPIADTEYIVIGKEIGVKDKTVMDVILQDQESGQEELWTANDDYAGYVIVIDGIGFEYVQTLTKGDIKW